MQSTLYFNYTFEPNKRRQKEENLFNLNVAPTIVFNMWRKGEKQRQTALVDLFCIFTVWLIVPPCHAGFCLCTLSQFSFWASTPGKHASFCSMQTSGKDNLSDFSKLFHKNAGSILLFPQHFIQTSEQIGGKSIHISNLSEK